MSETFVLVARSLLATALVLGALLALQWLAHKRVRLRVPRGSRRGRLLEVLETSFLPEGASLHVVRIGERSVVIGRSSNSVALLCAVSDEPAAAHGAE